MNIGLKWVKEYFGSTVVFLKDMVTFSSFCLLTHFLTMYPFILGLSKKAS